MFKIFSKTRFSGIFLNLFLTCITSVLYIDSIFDLRRCQHSIRSNFHTCHDLRPRQDRLLWYLLTLRSVSRYVTSYNEPDMDNSKKNCAIVTFFSSVLSVIFTYILISRNVVNFDILYAIAFPCVLQVRWFYFRFLILCTLLRKYTRTY